jgi:hypothetical protein
VAEGTGLENRQGVTLPRGFESHSFRQSPHSSSFAAVRLRLIYSLINLGFCPPSNLDTFAAVRHNPARDYGYTCG